MALPTKTDLLGGDWSYGGLPYIEVAAKTGIDLDGLEYSYGGLPFLGTEEPAAAGGLAALIYGKLVNYGILTNLRGN